MTGPSEAERPAATVPPLPPRLADPIPVIVGVTGLWFVGFAILLVSDLISGAPLSGAVWVCLAGGVLGLVGLAITIWQRRARRRGSRSAQRV